VRVSRGDLLQPGVSRKNLLARIFYKAYVQLARPAVHELTLASSNCYLFFLNRALRKTSIRPSE